MRLEIKPLSVNKVWQGKRFKTKVYKDYERDVLMLLSKDKASFHGDLEVNITFGFSSKLSDLDNPVKPFLDILCKHYNFDDRQIVSLNIRKELVKKGKEFINFEIK